MRSSLALALLLLLTPLSGARTGESLRLSRGQAREDGGFNLYVTGALPGQSVILMRYLGLPTDEEIDPSGFWKQLKADPLGEASIAVGPEDWTLPSNRQVGQFFLTVKAFAEGADGGLESSNHVLLKSSPVLYLLVEGLPGTAGPTRVMRFDVVTEELSQVGENVVRHAVRDPSDLYRRNHFDVAGLHETVFYESADDPMRLWHNRPPEPGRHFDPQAPLLNGERILDIRAARDHSGVLTLTGQPTPDGRWHLRLRLFDLATMRWEAASTVMQADSALDAWLVVDESSPRVYVANPSNTGDRIREFVVSGDLVPGLWIPPTPEPSKERLFDFAVRDDIVVALCEARDEDKGRLVIIDRGDDRTQNGVSRDAFVRPLPSRPRDFDLIRRGSGFALVVLFESGQVLSYDIDPGQGVTRTQELPVIPGAIELAVSEVLNSAFLLMPLGDQRIVVRIDLDTAGITPMEELSFSRTAQHLGVVGDSSEEWLFLLERVDEFQYDDTLISIGMDAATRTVSRPFRMPLNGTVTRIRVQ